MHRDLGAFLLRGLTPREAFANLLGRETGPTRGRDANLHGMSALERGIIGFISHLPHSLPVALGVAMSFRYRDEPHVAMAFTGDGASNAGLYHEVLNMAGLYCAPLVIIVENNQYAYSTPCQQASKVKSICNHAAGYGLQTMTVDGNDVEAVHAVAMAAVQRARDGDGPSLIEAHTLRMLGHAVHDGAEYVPRELLSEWEARDPVVGYRRKLAAAAVTANQLDEIDRRCRDEVEDAVAFAEASPWPDPSTVTDGVYAGAQQPSEG
jgi:pyruvate dehydrogenase E1 component alpha subunit